jgi:hypothetical protein
MNMDLLSSNDDSKSETFIPAPLDSSKLVQTPPEYQDDAISIQEDDHQEQEGDGGSHFVFTEHTMKGDICE